MGALKKPIHIANPGESKMEQETKRFNKRALIGSVIIHLFFFLVRFPRLEMAPEAHDEPKLIPIKMELVTPPSKSALIKNKVTTAESEKVIPPKVEEKKIDNGTDRVIKKADRLGDKTSKNHEPVQKGDPGSKIKEKYKPNTEVKKLPRTQIGSGSAASNVKATDNNPGGSGDTYHGEDFTNVTNSLLANGRGIKRNAEKGAADDGGAGKGRGGGIGDGIGGGGGNGFITGSPNGTPNAAKVAVNQGSLTGSAHGKIDSTYGFEGIDGKRGSISVAGMPIEKVAVSTIDPDAIRRLLRDAIPHFKSCYQKELDRSKEADGFQGVMNFKFLIGSDGRVTKSSVTSEEIKSDKVRDCMTDVLHGIHFPAPKGGKTVEVNQPINLYPRRI